MTRAAISRRGWQTIAAALALAAFLLALVGLRGQTAAAAETAQASRASTVAIPGFEFRPATLTIAPGSKVRFSNTSGRVHTATRPGSFDTGRIKPGNSASIAFNRRGAFSYHCKIHPFMRGKVVVG